MSHINKYLRRVATRLAKERRAKPGARPEGQKDKTEWTTDECYQEIILRHELKEEKSNG